MTTWITATATVRGSLHDRAGHPNEDHARVSPDGSVVAVADGHGAERYTRADRGAALATAAALDVLQPRPLDLDELPRALVDRWHELVAADVDADPPSTDELQGGPPHHLYGTTLLAAATTADGLVLVQLGDGDILLGHRGEDRAHVPIPPREYALANATDSMVQDDAADNVRTALVADRPDFVVLASDGLEAASGRRGWRDAVVAELWQQLPGRDPGSLERLLDDRCRRSADTGGDDTTIGLFVSRDLVAS